MRRILKKGSDISRFRGIVMLTAAGIALDRGWKIHTGLYALLAYGLGAAALGLAAWHFARKTPDRRK